MERKGTSRALVFMGILLALMGGYILVRSLGIDTTPNNPIANPVAPDVDNPAAPDISTTTADQTPPVTNPTPNIQKYGEVVLKVGQSASFPNLTITVIKIGEDSRCPKNVQCIQAGTVKVDLKIVSALGTSNKTIALGETVTTEAENISFKKVSPDKLTTQSISFSDYRLTFEITKRPAEFGKCYIGGCSGQICSDRQDVVSTCEYRAEYACYKTAKCERQASGQCGFTETSELAMCLSNPPAI